MKLLKLTPIFLLAAMLFACDDISDLKDIIQESSSSVENLSLEEDFEKIVINNYYSIMLPKYFSSSNILNDEASLQYQNILKDVYVVIINESKQEFIDTFREYEIYDDSLSVVQNLRDGQLQNLTQFLIDSELISEKSTSLRGLDIELMEIKATIIDENEEYDLAYSLAFVEGKEELYTMYFWCKQSQFEKYQNTFQKSISTFRELR